MSQTISSAVSYKERVAEAMALTALTTRLDAVRANGEFAPEVIDQFAEFLNTASEEELYRMSPLRYGAAHALTEAQAIDLFLHATHTGILEFNWGLLCPSCGAFLTTASALKALTLNQKCELCQVVIPGSIDDSVEVAFTISPTVRKIRYHDTDALDFSKDWIKYYFSTSLDVPEKFIQGIMSAQIDLVRVASGARADMQQDLKPGGYILAALVHHAFAHIQITDKATSSEAILELQDGQFVPNKIKLKPGKVVLTVRNRTSRNVQLNFMSSPNMDVLEHDYNAITDFAKFKPFLTGKRLVTSQTFRDLFHSESIPAEGGLEFKNLTLLFTDLKGSTEMYRRIGDFRAYALVREHFALLKTIVGESGGALVKTIGDAIMASFADPAQALQAATTMNKKIQEVGRDEDLVLKIGIHAGPCIAVELNERLDYFGQTVNIAARVQGVASASEIVVTDAVYGSPRVRDVIGGANLLAKKDTVPLKGVADDYAIYRLRMDKGANVVKPGNMDKPGARG